MTISTLSIARISHEVNRLYCRAIGDYSQVPWADAPAWQVQSAIHGVELHMKFPNLDDSASHEAWLREKLADGWKYGPVKDVLKKEHPCCVPFDELPAAEKVKDTLFRSVVRAMAPVWSGE